MQVFLFPFFGSSMTTSQNPWSEKLLKSLSMVRKPTILFIFSTIASTILFCFLSTFWLLTSTTSTSSTAAARQYALYLEKGQNFSGNGVLFVNGTAAEALGGVAVLSEEGVGGGNSGQDGILISVPGRMAHQPLGEAPTVLDERKDFSGGFEGLDGDENTGGVASDGSLEESSDLDVDEVSSESVNVEVIGRNSYDEGEKVMLVDSLGYNGSYTVSDDKKGTPLPPESISVESIGRNSEDERGGQGKGVLVDSLGHNGSYIVSGEQKETPLSSHSASRERVPSPLTNFDSSHEKSCDIYHGRWVFDDNYPLYTNTSCPFIDEGFNCEANGRKDTGYMKWRWQPHNCNIPRFDPVKMLQMIRGKRLVFVGDSINRNQWESMLCLLSGAISDRSRVYEARRRRITKSKGNYNFKFPDYDCSVEYYVSHYLVQEGKARVGDKRRNTLRIDAIDKTSSRWRGADILVFNSAHWWSHHKTQAGLNYFQEGNMVYRYLDASSAFRKALMTWASWVDKYVIPFKTQVFFRSSAPSHFSGGEWNSGGHCKESTRPLNDTSSRQIPNKNIILQQIVKQMKTPVTILNITNLSGLRIDGHPSIYGQKPDNGRRSNIQDCSHWCLPGVPDIWNELLYYQLLLSRKTNNSR